ncbi:MAG: glycerate kinase [Ignavibacteria bacterium]|nr:glycerate kinase [Ignavibacteria bacterium]
MKILICPDSFKGTLTAIEVAEIVGKVLLKYDFDVTLKPIADGGEGTIDIIQYSLGGTRNYLEVHNPLGNIIETYYLTVGDSAYIEFAKSSGLMLLSPAQLNPFTATSYGFGELIKDAIVNGYKNIILTLGGSATNDAGLGMLQALGSVFFDYDGNDLSNLGKSFLNAASLYQIFDFDIQNLKNLIKNINFQSLSDVTNPLLGANGATYIYAKQKGASPNDIEKLESALTHFSNLTLSKLSKNMNFPAAAAAGGVGASAAVFLNASVKSGINEIIRILNLDYYIKNSDIVITGEGSMDFQTAFGKAPFGIAKIAKKYKKTVIGITGKTGNNAEELLNKGFDCILSSYENKELDLNILKKFAKQNLEILSITLSDIILKGKIKNKIIFINK